MEQTAQSADFVRRFSEKASSDSTFSLDLLRAIDSTVDSLTTLARVLEPNVMIAQRLLERLPSCAFSEPLDEDGIIVANLKAAHDGTQKVRDRLHQVCESARAEPGLVDHHKEAVIDACDVAIEVVDGFIEVCSGLSDAVLAHDAKLLEVVGPFDTVDALFERLRA